MKWNKTLILIFVIILIIIFLVILFNVKYKTSNAQIQLYGELEMVIYKDEKYIENGYSIIKKYDDTKEYKVNIVNNLNVNVIGDYIIKYQLIFDNKVIDEVIRSVRVITNPFSDIVIGLNGESTTYVWLNEEYQEKGATAYRGSVDLSSQLEIIGNVDTSQIGTYELEYCFSLNGIKKSIKRLVKVINISVEEKINYNDSQIELNVLIDDFYYVTLPNAGVSYTSKVVYPITKNGSYEFIIYNKYGLSKTYVIDIVDYDKSAPTGSCMAIISNNTKVLVSANDENGISKYIYNGKTYDENTFVIDGEVSDVMVRVYDKFDNYTDLNCSTKRLFDNNMNEIIGSTVLTPCQNDWTKYNNELDKTIAEIGYKTRDAVAYAATYLAEFDYMVAYSWGGKYLQKGINPSWGCNASVTKEICSKKTGSFKCIYGMDCTGYTAWAFVQAGFSSEILRTHAQSTGNWGQFDASKHKYSFVGNQDKVDFIKVGDLVHTEGHVGIVIGTSDNLLKVANMHDGILISYINKSDGKSINGDKSFDNFVLFDDFFQIYGIDNYK